MLLGIADICCVFGRLLDVLRFVVLALVGCGGCSDHGRAEDIAELDVALHHICDPIRGRFSLCIICIPGRLIEGQHHHLLRIHRRLSHTTATPSSSRYDSVS